MFDAGLIRYGKVREGRLMFSCGLCVWGCVWAPFDLEFGVGVGVGDGSRFSEWTALLLWFGGRWNGFGFCGDWGGLGFGPPFTEEFFPCGICLSFCLSFYLPACLSVCLSESARRRYSLSLLDSRPSLSRADVFCSRYGFRVGVQTSGRGQPWYWYWYYWHYSILYIDDMDSIQPFPSSRSFRGGWCCGW